MGTRVARDGLGGGAALQKAGRELERFMARGAVLQERGGQWREQEKGVTMRQCGGARCYL
jgi:hypothetical protein